MADPDMDEDLFADLYDGEENEPDQAPPKSVPQQQPAPVKQEQQSIPEPMVTESTEPQQQFHNGEEKFAGADDGNHNASQGFQGGFGQQNSSFQNHGAHHNEQNERPIGNKEDG